MNARKAPKFQKRAVNSFFSNVAAAVTKIVLQEHQSVTFYESHKNQSQFETYRKNPLLNAVLTYEPSVLGEITNHYLSINSQPVSYYNLSDKNFLHQLQQHENVFISLDTDKIAQLLKEKNFADNFEVLVLNAGETNFEDMDLDEGKLASIPGSTKVDNLNVHVNAGVVRSNGTLVSSVRAFEIMWRFVNPYEHTYRVIEALAFQSEYTQDLFAKKDKVELGFEHLINNINMVPLILEDNPCERERENRIKMLQENLTNVKNGVLLTLTNLNYIDDFDREGCILSLRSYMDEILNLAIPISTHNTTHTSAIYTAYRIKKLYEESILALLNLTKDENLGDIRTQINTLLYIMQFNIEKRILLAEFKEENEELIYKAKLQFNQLKQSLTSSEIGNFFHKLKICSTAEKEVFHLLPYSSFDEKLVDDQIVYDGVNSDIDNPKATDPCSKRNLTTLRERVEYFSRRHEHGGETCVQENLDTLYAYLNQVVKFSDKPIDQDTISQNSSLRIKEMHAKNVRWLQEIFNARNEKVDVNEQSFILLHIMQFCIVRRIHEAEFNHEDQDNINLAKSLLRMLERQLVIENKDHFRESVKVISIVEKSVFKLLSGSNSVAEEQSVEALFPQTSRTGHENPQDNLNLFKLENVLGSSSQKNTTSKSAVFDKKVLKKQVREKGVIEEAQGFYENKIYATSNLQTLRQQISNCASRYPGESGLGTVQHNLDALYDYLDKVDNLFNTNEVARFSSVTPDELPEKEGPVKEMHKKNILWLQEIMKQGNETTDQAREGSILLLLMQFGMVKRIHEAEFNLKDKTNLNSAKILCHMLSSNPLNFIESLKAIAIIEEDIFKLLPDLHPAVVEKSDCENESWASFFKTEDSNSRESTVSGRCSLGGLST